MASRRQRLRAGRARGSRQRHPPRTGRRRSLPPLIIIPIGAVAVVAIIAAVAFARQGTGAPGVGDHWHSVLQIAICGQELPALPMTSSAFGIHTHGDGLIHTHPETSAQTGGNADLDHFFQSTGQSVRFDSSRIKWGDQEWRNGDACPDDGRAGRVRLLVNGLENDKFGRYVPQSGDLIRIEFTTETNGSP